MRQRIFAPAPLAALLLLLAAAALLLVGLPLARAGDDTLFEDPPGAAALAGDTIGDPDDTAVTRARRVAVNWRALADPETTRIALNLFDGRVVTAVHTRTERSPAVDGFVWIGHVPGYDGSAVSLSVAGDTLTGDIRLAPGDSYRIRRDEQGQLLQALDPRRAREVGSPDDTISPVPPPDAPAAAAEGALCEDGSRIDLLVAYTREARDAQGGRAGIESFLNSRVAEMNTANKDSGVNFTFNLVHLMETGYRESGNVRTDLERLQAGQNGLAGVLAARDQYKADLAALVIGESDTNFSCGIAYLLNSNFAPTYTAFANHAFNVTALDYAGQGYFCGHLTLAHEFGHGMGNRHDRANDSGTGPVRPYAYGYQSPQETFRTIMAYSCSGGYCDRVARWSSPRATFAGEPTGIDHAQDPAKSADNARSMNELARYVANFRPDCAASPTATPTAQPSATPTATPTATATATAQPGATAVPPTAPPAPRTTSRAMLPLLLGTR